MEKMYKTYIVKARRMSNNKVFEAEVGAYSVPNARHCFRECYRHDIYEILNVTEKITSGPDTSSIRKY